MTESISAEERELVTFIQAFAAGVMVGVESSAWATELWVIGLVVLVVCFGIKRRYA